MENLNFINGATVTATDVRKSWKQIVEGVKESKKPVYVYTNNKPEAVVLDVEEYRALEQQAKKAMREEAGRQLSETYRQFMKDQNLVAQPMKVAEDGVFYEAGDAE